MWNDGSDCLSRKEDKTLLANPLRIFSLRRAADTCNYCRHPLHISPFYKGGWMGPDSDQPFTTYQMTYPIKCGSRLAEVCPSCSMLYGIDATRLVALGLFGDGDNVPLTVAGNSCLWFTLTVPSFGRVHHYVERNGQPGICHPGKKEYCEHGTKTSCARTHEENDALNGTPLCPDCYDFVGQILANATAPELWDRFRDHDLYRSLARELGIDRDELRNLVKIEAVKTSEMQGRLAVHFHGFIRLDGPSAQGSAPLVKISGARLVKVFKAAAAKTVLHKKFRAYKGDPDSIKRDFRWGIQVDVVVINEHNAKFFAWYAAKYATKGATSAKGFAYVFRDLAQIEAIGDDAWWPRLLGKVCWQMGADPHFERLRLREHAHTFGFGGWFITKTRRWSVTFGALKRLRVKWAIEHANPDYPADLNIPVEWFRDPDVTWGVAGHGWQTKLDARAVRVWWRQSEIVRELEDLDRRYWRDVERRNGWAA